MKRMIHLSLLLLLFLTAGKARAKSWPSILDSIRHKMVLIEYYEGIRSSESIQGQERIKKYLSGFVVTADGLIVTSANIFRANLEFSGSAPFLISHLKPTQIRVKFEGQAYQAAEFVGKDEDSRLAFIRLKSTVPLSFIKFKKQVQPAIGNKVLFVQHLPKRFDFQPVLRERRINAKLNKTQPVFLCDEPASPALSSFGLVADDTGAPIGLLQPDKSAHAFRTSFGQNLARFILFDQFAKLITHPPLFKEKKTVRKKWLGIYSQPFTRELARYFKQDTLRGVLISTVIDNSPAQKAGLLSGDVIVSLDGKALFAEKDSDLDTFRQRIRQKEDRLLKVKVFRQGKYLKKKVQLGETPISQFLASETSYEQLGFSVKELTRDIILAKQLSFDTQGVWVSRVERAGWADVAGLRVGDLILKMNEKTVNSLQSIKEEITTIEAQKPEYVRLFIKRQSDTEFLFIKTNY